MVGRLHAKKSSVRWWVVLIGLAPVLQASAREIRRPILLDGRSEAVVQTMCVRTCDGYYWPQRYPASPQTFAQDAHACATSCGAPTKLYWRSDLDDPPEDMRDEQGQFYDASPTAFAYRRGLVPGCACRPAPWSASEKARHDAYAEADARGETASAKPEVVVSTAAVRYLREVETSGPAPGPAEAAAIAAFVEDTADSVDGRRRYPLRPMFVTRVTRRR